MNGFVSSRKLTRMKLREHRFVVVYSIKKKRWKKKQQSEKCVVVTIFHIIKRIRVSAVRSVSIKKQTQLVQVYLERTPLPIRRGKAVHQGREGSLRHCSKCNVLWACFDRSMCMACCQRLNAYILDIRVITSNEQKALLRTRNYHRATRNKLVRMPATKRNFYNYSIIIIDENNGFNFPI